jgi:hypothetical protein
VGLVYNPPPPLVVLCMHPHLRRGLQEQLRARTADSEAAGLRSTGVQSAMHPQGGVGPAMRHASQPLHGTVGPFHSPFHLSPPPVQSLTCCQEEHR